MTALRRKDWRQDDSPSCLDDFHPVIVAFAAAALLTGACHRGEAGAPRDPDEVPEARFGFELAGYLDPPGPEGFWEPADIEVDDAGGAIWIVDRKADCVYRYDLDGVYRGRVSRQGSGPGELSEALALGMVGDTLWVFNAGNRRIDYFGMGGETLATQPLPDGSGAVVDVIAVGGEFVASTVFGQTPLVRFPRAPGAATAGSARGFGQELASMEADLAGRAAPKTRAAIPPVYRVVLVGGRIWALHLYLPLVGIFAADGRLIRLVTYPADPVEPGGESVQEIDGVRRRVQNAPLDPGGAIGLLEGTAGEIYLLTHQSDSGRQRLYALNRDGDLIGRVESPFAGWLAVSAGDGGNQRYVLAARGETEEPAVIRLRARRP